MFFAEKFSVQPLESLLQIVVDQNYQFDDRLRAALFLKNTFGRTNYERKRESAVTLSQQYIIQ